MRIPKINNYNNTSDQENLELCDSNFSKPMYVFYTDKVRTKFIKRIEKIVRGSLEYRELISCLRNNFGMTYCMFFQNVSRDKGKRVGIEIHHMPFSLYDIVNIVLRKYEVNEMEIDPYIIAEEVIKLHYQGKVGLVPLSSTVHELYHRGDIFIPLQNVDKGFVKFYSEYKEYASDYDEMLRRLIVMSKEYTPERNNILKKKLIIINDENSVPNKIY